MYVSSVFFVFLSVFVSPLCIVNKVVTVLLSVHVIISTFRSFFLSDWWPNSLSPPPPPPFPFFSKDRVIEALSGCGVRCAGQRMRLSLRHLHQEVPPHRRRQPVASASLQQHQRQRSVSSTDAGLKRAQCDCLVPGHLLRPVLVHDNTQWCSWRGCRLRLWTPN